MKIKIALPIVIALIVVLGTAGIVLASTLIQRQVNLSVVDPSITVEPTPTQSIEIYPGTQSSQNYTITNNNVALPVSVTIGTLTTLPQGVTVTFSDSVFQLAPSASRVVTITFTATAEAPIGATSIILDFTVTPIS